MTNPVFDFDNSWRPNWQDAKQYLTKEASTAEWAWEFLRRNESFQTECRKLTELSNSEERLQAQAVVTNNFKFISMAVPDYRKPLCPFTIFQSQVGPGYVRYFEGGDELGNQSQLSPDSHGKVIVEFDLNQPINIQIDRIKSELIFQQSRLKKSKKILGYNKRINLEPLQRYLRILDAHYCQATTSEISAVIFPLVSNVYPDYLAKQKVADSLKAAKKYCDSDYHLIPLSTQKAEPKK
jgi:hypothetical protein